MTGLQRSFELHSAVTLIGDQAAKLLLGATVFDEEGQTVGITISRPLFWSVSVPSFSSEPNPSNSEVRIRPVTLENFSGCRLIVIDKELQQAFRLNSDFSVLDSHPDIESAAKSFFNCSEGVRIIYVGVAFDRDTAIAIARQQSTPADIWKAILLR